MALLAGGSTNKGSTVGHRAKTTGVAVKRRDWWERFFLFGIAAKGFNGAAEIIGGIVLLLAGPRSLNGVALALTRNELTEDPNDFIATHLLHITERATQGSVLFAAIYLLIHGVVKLVLVVAILRGKIWAYPWMIGVLAVFVAYQGYQISIAPSTGLVALTVFDAIVAYLTWHEYKRHRRRAAALG